MALDTLLTSPNFNETFTFHTDASTFQLRSFIIQKGKPIDLHSKKLNVSQKRYTVNEKGQLSIVETLKEFRTIFLGKKLIIYTYNKDLTCKVLNTGRVLIWILILEEYGLDI